MLSLAASLDCKPAMFWFSTYTENHLFHVHLDGMPSLTALHMQENALQSLRGLESLASLEILHVVLSCAWGLF